MTKFTVHWDALTNSGSMPSKVHLVGVNNKTLCGININWSARGESLRNDCQNCRKAYQKLLKGE